MHNIRRLRRSLLPWAVGCFGVFGLGATPALAVPYGLLTTIAIAPGGVTQSLSSFDISYFDGTTQNFYLADRTNAAVDVLSAQNNSFVTQVGAGGFTGFPPAGPPAAGPNGVIVAAGQLFAGNGDSTVHTFGISGTTYTPGATITTGASTNLRADEMAYDPTGNVLAVANDAASPSPYLTLLNATSHATIATITLNGAANSAGGTSPNATAGLEQTVWVPGTGATPGAFYSSIPQIGGGTDPGGILEFNAAGNVIKTFSLAALGTAFGTPITSCGPTGLVQGSGNQLLIACGNGGTQTILFDPTANGGAGGIVKIIKNISGSDEIAYDPTNGLFFVTNSTPGELGIIDSAGNFLGSLTTAPGAHSVAVDPVSNEVFVPLGASAGNTICPGGCIGVYAYSPVPEPGSASLLVAGLLGLIGVTGFGWHRRRATRL